MFDSPTRASEVIAASDSGCGYPSSMIEGVLTEVIAAIVVAATVSRWRTALRVFGLVLISLGTGCLLASAANAINGGFYIVS